MTAQRLMAALKARNWRLATAESCTAGLIAGAVTQIAGSSAVFDRGYVTYSNTAKVEMLGVLPATLEAFGAVSEQVAAEMVQGARTLSGAQIAVSVTGIAGPGGSEHKPEGRVCFGYSLGQTTQTETVEFGPLGRSQVRTATVEHALDRLVQLLAEVP